MSDSSIPQPASDPPTPYRLRDIERISADYVGLLNQAEERNDAAAKRHAERNLSLPISFLEASIEEEPQ